MWEPEFQTTWSEMLSRDPHAHVFQRPELFRAWAETHAATLGLEAMVGFATDGHVRALLPLVTVRYRGRFIRRRVLEPPGRLFLYHDPLVDSPVPGATDWPAFWEAFRMAMGRACDHALLPFVHDRYARGPRSEPSSELQPVLNLAGMKHLDAVLARCSASHRGDVRRQLRRLAEKGEVTLWVAGPAEGPAAVSDLTEYFLAAYDTVWRSKPAGNMFARPGLVDFARRVVAEGVPGGWVNYSVLRVAGTPVAWHIGLVHRQDLYYWIPTYHRKWDNFSPGKVLLAKLIEHSLTRDWKRIHLLTGDQPYKLAWKPDYVERRTVRWHASSLRGRACAVYDWFNG